MLLYIIVNNGIKNEMLVSIVCVIISEKNLHCVYGLLITPQFLGRFQLLLFHTALSLPVKYKAVDHRPVNRKMLWWLLEIGLDSETGMSETKICIWNRLQLITLIFH